MSFVPLCVYSEYSMLQSPSSIDRIINACKREKISAIGLCDNGVMYGAFKFYEACKKNNIKPIIGVKVVCVINNNLDGLLLYAMNSLGYTNIMRICSKFKITGKPLDLEDIKKWSSGVIAITPGEDSFVYSLIRNNKLSVLKQHLSCIQSVFDSFYVGISSLTKETRDNMDYIYNCINSYNYKMVALNPTLFLDKSDIDCYQTLKSIKANYQPVSIDEKEQNAYLYNEALVRRIYYKHLDLIEATNEIMNNCNVEIETGKTLLPEYEEGVDAKEYLWALCTKGLRKRLQKVQNINFEIYKNRLVYEYKTICEMGFADYFLIVWDYVKYAKQNGIFVGLGRGSAGASLIAYCLGITEVDPIKYNLLFERFLNKERVSMPDIDIDFPDDDRDKVIQYVGKRYGSGNVAHIATFGTFQSKMALSDTAKVFKLPENYLKQVNKCIQNYAKTNSINQISLQEIIDNDDNIKQLMTEYDEINKVLTVASKLQGLPRNVSTHAAGIIITKYNLLNYTPVDNGLDGVFQTQFEASDLEKIGLLKMDFLGLKNLTNIDKTIKIIKKDNPNFVLPQDENDPATYRMLASGDVVGVFQLESAGMRKVIMDLRTSSFDDIVAALALYRPGPKDIIPHYISRKFGTEKVTYPHVDLENILKETYGTIVYQEQIILIACKFAGYTLGRADILRRAVSKKKKDVLEKERIDFVNSSVKLGYQKNIAEEIYDYIVKFADYGFNKAHSVAYAKLAFLTAYLKCHYPAYYMATLMTSTIGSETDILTYYKEAIRKGIRVFCPDINYSTKEFISPNGCLLFPLQIIRGLGDVKVKEIIDVRKKGVFTSFQDFLIRTKDILPLSIVPNIIFSGALDGFGLTKKSMIENYKKEIELLDYLSIPGMKKPNYSNEEYSYGFLLEQEKNSIGLNIKYNFFMQYQNVYINKKLMKIQDAKENQKIRTLGILHSIKNITTKNKENMAFATLEDDETKIELTIFPTVYSKVGSNLREDAIVIIYGNVQKRNELQVLVDDIEFL